MMIMVTFSPKTSSLQEKKQESKARQSLKATEKTEVEQFNPFCAQYCPQYTWPRPNKITLEILISLILPSILNISIFCTVTTTQQTTHNAWSTLLFIDIDFTLWKMFCRDSGMTLMLLMMMTTTTEQVIHFSA